MRKKKSKLDEAVEKTAAILESHMSTLPPARAKAMRKDLHVLAVKSSRNASRGTSAKSRRSAGPHPLSRISAKRS